jgi:hypothetical protein
MKTKFPVSFITDGDKFQHSGFLQNAIRKRVITKKIGYPQINAKE